MPAMTSTCPASCSALQQLDGVPPLMSVMTSTPSPSSRRRIAWRACSLTSCVSWSAVTSIASKRSVGPRNTCATAAMNAWPSGAWVISRMPTMSLMSGYLGFDGVDEHRSNVEAGLVGDLLETGRAGDIHLGQEIADHIQSYQQQAPLGQHRAKALGDLAVPFGQRLGHAEAAGGQVAAHFAGLRNARPRARRRLAADDPHPPVALDYDRDVLLGHDGPRAVVRDRFDDRS